MDDTILERLILDDALGTLSPDASALLAAHIQTLASGSERLAAWRRLADTARNAMPTESPEALPPFPVHKNPWRIGPVGVSIAASLLIGIGIGLLFPHRPATSPQLAIVPPTVVAEIPNAVGVHDFWSSQRLLASAMAEKHRPSAAWHWTSPMNRPEMGEMK